MLLDSRGIWHPIGNGFALCDWIDWLPVVAMECFQPLALLDIENAIVAKQYGSLVLSSPVLRFSFAYSLNFQNETRVLFSPCRTCAPNCLA